jgi:uncharacterized membrane protein YfcA
MAKKHLLFHIWLIIGSAIGIVIFGDIAGYFKTLIFLILGYWLGFYYWWARQKADKRTSNCNLADVNGSLPLTEADIYGEAFTRSKHIDAEKYDGVSFRIGYIAGYKDSQNKEVARQ